MINHKLLAKIIIVIIVIYLLKEFIRSRKSGTIEGFSPAHPYRDRSQSWKHHWRPDLYPWNAHIPYYPSSYWKSRWRPLMYPWKTFMYGGLLY
jgi:hypothetical protein